MNTKSNLRAVADVPPDEVDEGALSQAEAVLSARRGDLAKLRARLTELEKETLSAARSGDLAGLDRLGKEKLLAENAARTFEGVLVSLESERDSLRGRVEAARREENRRQRLETALPEREKAETAYQAATAAAEAAFEAPLHALLALRRARAHLVELNASITMDGGGPPGVGVVAEEEFLRLRRVEITNRHLGGRRFECPLPAVDWTQ